MTAEDSRILLYLAQCIIARVQQTELDGVENSLAHVRKIESEAREMERMLLELCG